MVAKIDHTFNHVLSHRTYTKGRRALRKAWNKSPNLIIVMMIALLVYIAYRIGTWFYQVTDQISLGIAAFAAVLIVELWIGVSLFFPKY